MWWTPTYLIRNFGLTPGEAGSILGPIHLIGGGLATLATSWWLAQPKMKDPRRIVRMMGWGVGLATVVSGVIYSTRSLELAQWLFWLFIPAIYFYIGPCFGLLNNLCEPRMRAQFCAATLFVANVGNLIVAPQLVGFLSDAFPPDNVANGQSLRLAMLCLVPAGAWVAKEASWRRRLGGSCAGAASGCSSGGSAASCTGLPSAPTAGCCCGKTAPVAPTAPGGRKPARSSFGYTMLAPGIRLSLRSE